MTKVVHDFLQISPGFVFHSRSKDNEFCLRRKQVTEPLDTLEEILTWSRSDKVWQHEYHKVYEDLLAPLRHKSISFLEIGIDRGMSMKAWAKYFTHPESSIIGAGLVNKEHEYFDKDSDSRIRILHADQNNDEDLRRLAQTGPFHLVIDDGSHIPSHQRKTFLFLWKFVFPEGLYIIEDIETSFWDKSRRMYGYPLEHETSLVDTFLDFVKEDVNSEFSKGRDLSDILSIGFSRNLIVIKKRGSRGNREYRHRKFLFPPSADNP